MGTLTHGLEDAMTRFAIILLACSVASTAFGQVPTISSVHNAASHDNRLCPGAIATLSGTFAPKATVTIGGIQAHMFYTTTTQLIFQIPPELSPGGTRLVVSAGGTASAPFSLNLDTYAPAFYTVDSSGKGPAFAILIPSLLASTFSDSPADRISSSKPVHRGEFISLTATGLGPTTPPAHSGGTTPIAAFTTSSPTVTVGGKQAIVLFSGILGTVDISLVGTYMVTLIVPPDSPAGLNKVVLSIGQKSSNVVTLVVAP
jgi:uncharacterized protein (TIGR03437 family)